MADLAVSHLQSPCATVATSPDALRYAGVAGSGVVNVAIVDAFAETGVGALANGCRNLQAEHDNRDEGFHDIV